MSAAYNEKLALGQRMLVEELPTPQTSDSSSSATPSNETSQSSTAGITLHHIAAIFQSNAASAASLAQDSGPAAFGVNINQHNLRESGTQHECQSNLQTSSSAMLDTGSSSTNQTSGSGSSSPIVTDGADESILNEYSEINLSLEEQDRIRLAAIFIDNAISGRFDSALLTKSPSWIQRYRLLNHRYIKLIKPFLFLLLFILCFVEPPQWCLSFSSWTFSSLVSDACPDAETHPMNLSHFLHYATALGLELLLIILILTLDATKHTILEKEKWTAFALLLQSRYPRLFCRRPAVDSSSHITAEFPMADDAAGIAVSKSAVRSRMSTVIENGIEVTTIDATECPSIGVEENKHRIMNLPGLIDKNVYAADHSFLERTTFLRPSIALPAAAIHLGGLNDSTSSMSIHSSLAERNSYQSVDYLSDKFFAEPAGCEAESVASTPNLAPLQHDNSASQRMLPVLTSTAIDENERYGTTGGDIHNAQSAPASPLPSVVRAPKRIWLEPTIFSENLHNPAVQMSVAPSHSALKQVTLKRAFLDLCPTAVSTYIRIFLYMFSFVDILVSFAVARSFRFSPVLRPLLLLFSFSSMRSSSYRIFLSFRSTFDVLFLIMLLLVFFSWLGLLLFAPGDQSSVQDMNGVSFENFPQILFSLSVLLTTSNYPRVMMPMYQNSRFAFLFYFLFLAIGLYFLVPLVLAVILNSYRLQMHNMKMQEKSNTTKSLAAAFEVLAKVSVQREQADAAQIMQQAGSTLQPHKAGSELQEEQKKMEEITDTKQSFKSVPQSALRSSRSSHKFVSFALLLSLLRELSLFFNIGYLQKSRAAERLFFAALDTDRSGKIWKDEFLQFASVLRINFTKSSAVQFAKRRKQLQQAARSGAVAAPNSAENSGRSSSSAGMNWFFLNATLSNWRCVHTLYSSRAFAILESIVLHPRFEYGIDIIILFNAFLMALETVFDFTYDTSSNIYAEGLEIVFTIIYVLEFLCKMLVYGFEIYWNSPRNRFDFYFLVFSVAAEVYSLLNYETTSSAAMLPHSTLKTILLLRVLRLLRLLHSFKRFQIIINTYLRLLPSFALILMNLLFVFFLYAQLAIIFFGGNIFFDNEKLANTDFASSDYWYNNFNDFSAALVTLFELAVVNDWYTTSEGAVLSSAAPTFARLFFLSYYLVCVLIVLNIVVALILEGFIAQWEERRIHAKAMHRKKQSKLFIAQQTRTQARENSAVQMSANVRSLDAQMLQQQSTQFEEHKADTSMARAASSAVLSPPIAVADCNVGAPSNGQMARPVVSSSVVDGVVDSDSDEDETRIRDLIDLVDEYDESVFAMSQNDTKRRKSKGITPNSN